MMHYTQPDPNSHFFRTKGHRMHIVGAGPENSITKEYYNHLVGEINRGTILAAVVRIEDQRFNSVRYHKISIWDAELAD